MIRHILTVSSGTLASRMLGFVRDALTAALLGAGPVADAFLAAFQSINVARRLMTEGGLNAALVPAWLRVRDENGEAAAIAFGGKALATITLLIVLATILLALAMPWLIVLVAPGFTGDKLQAAIDMTRLMLPYLPVAGAAAVLMALLNAQSRFTFAAFSTVLFNATLIAVLVILLARGSHGETDGENSTHAAMMLAASVGLAGGLQLLVLFVRERRIATPIRLTLDPQLRELLLRISPGAIASTMPQLMLLAGVVLASHSAGSVSYLYFASRLIELPLGLVGVALGTVMVSELAQSVRSGDDAALRRDYSRGVLLSCGLSLPAAAGLAVLAEPIIRLLFQHGAFGADDARATAGIMAILALGLPAQVLIKSIAPVFFAHDDTMTPLRATIGGLVIALGLGLFLSLFRSGTAGADVNVQIAGVGIALTTATWCSCLYLFWRARRLFRLRLEPAAQPALIRIVFATAIMTAGLTIAATLMPQSGHRAVALLYTGGLILAGIAVYVAVLRLLGVLRWHEIVAALRR